MVLGAPVVGDRARTYKAGRTLRRTRTSVPGRDSNEPRPDVNSAGDVNPEGPQDRRIDVRGALLGARDARPRAGGPEVAAVERQQRAVTDAAGRFKHDAWRDDG